MNFKQREIFAQFSKGKDSKKRMPLGKIRKTEKKNSKISWIRKIIFICIVVQKNDVILSCKLK